MIILEGPDGAGKTTLLEKLKREFPPIQEHARASTSVGGPVDNIFDWAQHDVETWKDQPISFYDRHPLISEPIYGSVIRGTYDHRFDRLGKVLDAKMTRNALVIYCLPKLETVRANLEAEAQMGGVAEHIDQLWARYYDRMKTHHAKSAPTMFHYNYRRRGEFEDTCIAVEAHYSRYQRRLNGRLA